MKLKLGFSSCPNDTFIFDAWVHERIDTEGLDIEIVMEDVEALNRRAARRELEVTKLSYHAFAQLTEGYQLLDAGSALGRGCGPLLIAKRPMTAADLAHARIAIPGHWTTANFLFGVAYPEANNRIETLFSAIEHDVLTEKVDAGVIIHENRFTYQEKGLVKILDLGEYWETTTQMPIPLGGIVVRRDVPDALKERVSRVLKRSVAYAFAHPEASRPYVRAHAQEMEESVMQQHISLYVNHFTRSLGDEGRAAIACFLQTALEKGIIKEIFPNFFVY